MLNFQYICFLPVFACFIQVVDSIDENKRHQSLTCDGEKLSISCLDVAPSGQNCFIRNISMGQTCYTPDENDQVKKRCQGHESCNIPAENNVVGHACYRTTKTMKVSCTCYKAEYPLSTLITCESKTMYIRCPVTERIRIKYANYGRYDKETCYVSPHVDQACFSEDAGYQVKKRCDGHQACSVYVGDHVFGNPCISTPKYLDVKYICEKAEPCTLELCMKNGGTCSDSGCRCELGVSGKACLRVLPVYIGCFEERFNRAINERFYAFGAMSVEWCIRWCHYMGHKYAALQAAAYCFCGDGGYDKYGSSKNCDRPCSGNNTEVCGGIWANSVYSVLDEPCTSKLCKSNGGNSSDSGIRGRPVYIGCFTDGGRRATHEQFYEAMSMTVGWCIRRCHSLGYKYASLQDKTRCYCGDGDYNKYGWSSGCVMRCGGSNQEICGGRLANSVYSVVAEPCTLELCMKNGGTCSDSGCRCELGVSGKACLRVLPVYIGCFEEGHNRAMIERVYTSSSMTVEWCTRWCHYMGHKYAALEFAFVCICGDGGYDKYGVSTNCDMPCVGDNTKVCGGSWAASVYSVVGTQPVKP